MGFHENDKAEIKGLHRRWKDQGINDSKWLLAIGIVVWILLVCLSLSFGVTLIGSLLIGLLGLQVLLVYCRRQIEYWLPGAVDWIDTYLVLLPFVVTVGILVGMSGIGTFGSFGALAIRCLGW